MSILKWIEHGLSIIGASWLISKLLVWKGVDLEAIAIRGLEMALNYLNGAP